MSETTPLTTADIPFIRSRMDGVATMTDCLPYTYGFINRGVFKGNKVVSEDTLLLFSVKYGKYYRVYRAYGDKDAVIPELVAWWQAYKGSTDKNLKIENVPASWAADIAAAFMAEGVKLTPGKFSEYGEYTYDIAGIDTLSGKKWRRLRADINAFKRTTTGYTAEPIDSGNLEEARAVMKRWVKESKERGGMNINYRKYEYILDRHYEDGINRLYRIDGEPLVIHLNQPMTETCWGHTTGMACDRGIPNLSAWAQHDCFADMARQGVTHVADGVAIGEGGKHGFNATYKRKFNPFDPSPRYVSFLLPAQPVVEESPFFL